MKKTAYFSVITAALLWGCIGFFAKNLYSFGFNTLQIVFIRAISSCLTLIFFLLAIDRHLLKIKLRDSIYFIGTGIFSFVFFNWCYFISIKRTSLSIAAILLYTAPAFVMIFSAVLFREKITLKKVLSLLLTFAGCIFVTAFVKGTGQSISPSGILAGLGSGLGYALYSIFGRYALKKYNPLTVTAYTFIFASAGLIPITDISGMISIFLGTKAVFYGIALGLLCTVAPFLLYTKGLANLETSQASIIATLEPVVATILGIIVFNESITVFKVAGILMVVLAVYILKE